MKIAIIDKAPSQTPYRRLFELDKVLKQGDTLDILHMSSVKVPKLKVADIDLEVDFHEYDWVILVGAEATQRYSDVRSVANYTGVRVKEKEKQAKEALGVPGYDKFVVSISPASLRMKPQIKPVFDETVKNLLDILNDTVREKAPTDYTPITTEQQALDYLNLVLNLPVSESPAIAIDTETTGLKARNCEMLGLSMSHKTHQGVYIEADCLTEDVVELIQKIVDSGRYIVMQNAKFDMHITKYHLGLDYSKPIARGLFHDTMVIHYSLDERAGTHGLKALAIKYTDMGDYDRALDDFKRSYCKEHKIKLEQFTYDLIPFDIMWEYAAADTDATLRLFNKFYEILCRPQTKKVKWMYDTVLMPATVFLQRMEDRGLPVSTKRIQMAKKFLHSELARLEAEMYAFEEVARLEEMQGARFNANSVVQLRKLFFDVLRLTPTGIKTDTGADSTDKEVLEILAKQHPLPKTIHEYKKALKILNTFITSLEEGTDKDGKVRTNFGCTTTTSGRLSSSGTINAQQLPRDNPIVKGCIVAPKGYRIVAKDLSTAEVYYAAVLSGDKMLQQVFLNIVKDPKEYADFHSTIAHMVFKLDCKPSEVKKLYPALRQAAKAITFGILYGSGPGKVAESVNLANLENSAITGEPLPPTCTVDDAKGYIEDYFHKFPQLKIWVDGCHNQIRQVGFIYSFYGRKRRLRDFRSVDRAVVGSEIRSGFNAIIQSASSDTLLLGTMDADNEIIEKGLDIHIFGLVHDSIIALVREDLVDEYHEIIDRNIQKDRYNWDESMGMLKIPGAPIGIDSDSEVGGSRDYSCGKLIKALPFMAVLDDHSDDVTTEARETLGLICEGKTDTLDFKKNAKHIAAYKYRQELLDSLDLL